MEGSAAPVQLRIRLPYGTEEEFIERYGVNVARGGVFIATRSPKPEGTALQFEFVLAGGARLLRGEGVVLKSQSDESGGRPGMTVRFTRLDAPSRALVDRVMAFRSGPPPEAPTGVEIPERREGGPPALSTVPPVAADPEDSPPAASRSGDARSGTVGSTAARPRPPETASMGGSPREGPTRDDVVLGIDLGTTNARCAAVVDGLPRLIPLSPEGALWMPAVVALDEGDRLIVGARAKAQLLLDPSRAIFAPKRLLGRRARSRQVREWAARLPYSVAADSEGDAGVELGGTVHPLPELASKLLAVLREAAEEHLGHAIRRAILCVPAYFSDHQRTALFRAGRLAGLEVVRIFNEPSAVALAYGHGRGLARKRVLVFDLGGGTFDASVVQITGNDLEVVASGGDVFLGGFEFDDRISDQLAGELHTAGTLSFDAAALQRIRHAAEQAKILLSDVDRAPVEVRLESEFRTEITRAALDRLTADLVDRTMETTRAVLQAARLAPSSLDEVLVVGGQSLAPSVRRRVEEALGRKPRLDVDPHAAVALGAAVLGEAMVRAEKGRAGVRLSEILSLPIGIALRGGGMRRVLDRHTPLPAEKTLSVPVEAGAPLGVAVFQGDARIAEENEYLGSLRIAPERAGEAMLRFRVDADGTLHLVARAPGAREETVLATSDASDDVRAEIFASAPLPGESDAEAPAPGLLRGLKRLFGRR